MAPYQPIPCALHGRYELAAMRRQGLRLRGRDTAGVEWDVAGRALDLFSRTGEEFLLFETASGARLVFRLDQLDAVIALDGAQGPETLYVRCRG